MPPALLTTSRSQCAPKLFLLEQVPRFAVLCKQSEDSPELMAIEITSESLAGAQPERTVDYKESPLALGV